MRLKLKPVLCLLLAGLLCAQKPQGTLTNQRIGDLVQAGVSTEEIIRIIASAPKVSFDLRPGSTDNLLSAGATEDVIKAMAAREQGISTPAPAPEEIAPAPIRSAPVIPKRTFISPQPSPPLTARAAPSIAPTPPNRQSVPFMAGSLSDWEIDLAIQKGQHRGSIGLRLNDIQTSLITSLACRTCGQSGYTVTIYTPEEWVQMGARQAVREMLPFSAADVPAEMRMPLLHVVALPSTPDYLNGTGFSMASSVHRVVLSDTSRQITIQPLYSDNGSVETNSAFRSASFATGSAAFRMSDVQRLRAADPKDEFFVVVVGDRQNKFFKVKSKDFKKLFGKMP